MKIKKTTYGKFKERFSGFKRIGFEQEEIYLQTGGLMPITYSAIILYKKRENSTIVALTCIGYISVFGPSKDDLTYAIKFDGKVTAEDLIDKEFEHHERIKMITEELYNVWHKELEESKENES